MFGIAMLAGRRSGERRPATLVMWGFLLLTAGLVILIPDCAAHGLGLVAAGFPLIISGCGLGLLVSQLNNYTLSPISDERSARPPG